MKKKTKILSIFFLAWALLFQFQRPKDALAEIDTHEGYNKSYDEIILIAEDEIEDQVIESLKNENQHQKILLAKGNPSNSNFIGPHNLNPGRSFSRNGRYNYNPYMPRYRVAPKVNPYNNNNGPGKPGGNYAKFDDNPKSQNSKQDQTNYDRPSNYEKKKKMADECKIKKLKIINRIKENSLLTKEAKWSARNQDAQKSFDKLIKQLSLGNTHPGKGRKYLFNGVLEARGSAGARIYYKYNQRENTLEILAKSVKANQNKVVKTLRELYD
uniref:Uncharacterized protein n=1 Tax=Climaconeis cf. scalaris TaxID=2846828 RepID=A0A8F8SP06_9STRA|nr:hypothetical protein [Climaconeis cf. scalaris]QYB19179.1 hypothetical protein [Climaconeis cf. scalaris]